MRAGPGSRLARALGASICIMLPAPFAAQADPVPVLRWAQSEARPSASSVDARSDAAGVRGRFGTAADGMPFDREVRLGANTKSVGVWRFETIHFVSAGGGQFRWRFDTANELDRFPLAAIAPSGLAIPAGATVYVNGEIPVAP